MAKPAGAVCTLACDHCYVLRKETLFPSSSFRMRERAVATAGAWQARRPPAEAVAASDAASA